jgi:hypothetical protein
LPLLTQVYVTPLVFCEIPAFVHLPPFDAATVGVVKIEKVSRQTVNTQSGRLF